MNKTLLIKILYNLSGKILKKYHPDVIGIVGGDEVSSAKEAICSVLSGKFFIRQNQSVYGNDIEIPLSIIGEKTQEYSFFGWCRVIFSGIKLLIFKAKKYPDIIVLGIETKQPGDLDFLTKKISFRIGVVTGINNFPLGSFGSVKKLVSEQELLIKNLPDHGVVILNTDDEFVAEMNSKAQKINFGFNDDSQVRASEPVTSLGESSLDEVINGISFKLIHQGSVVPVLMPGVLGIGQVYSGLAAIACGLVFQMNLSDIATNLKKYKSPAGRMKILKGVKNTTIIDNSYDASFESVKSAIEALSTIPLPDKSEKYIIIGDIENLGNNTEIVHQQIGEIIAEMGIDKLITIGEKTKETALSAKKSGMFEDQVFSFFDTKGAGRFVQDRLEQKDIILVIGSAEMKMEKVVKELMGEPLKAKSLLVRRK